MAETVKIDGREITVTPEAKVIFEMLKQILKALEKNNGR